MNLDGLNAADLAGLTPAELLEVTDVPDLQAYRALFQWEFWARPGQLPPGGDWNTWLILAGRGYGKTRMGAETIRGWVDTNAGGRFALIGPTSADCRDVMLEGESGLLKCFPVYQRPEYESSKRRVTFHNGALAFLYSAEEPERLRGPQHAGAWCDEIAVYPDPETLWSNLRFGLRLGNHPRVIATTTPRPLRFLKKLSTEPGTVVTRGSTFENRHLSRLVLDELQRMYGGTRIGRQELAGELIEEAEGALWRRMQIDALRVSAAPDLVRLVVAIDPATTAGDSADECGIIAAGLGADGHGYILADGTCKLPPDQWATRAVSMFDNFGADRIIAETNNGGDLVESVIRTVRRNISYEKVTASRGKVARAEPVAALYEQGRVHHVGVAFEALEDEMANFVPGALQKSPNRADALVWALSWLMFKPTKTGRAL